MFLSANLLRVVNYDFLNQFIYCGGVKLLQIGIFIGKLQETSHIGNLPGFILNLPFQRNGKPLDFCLFCFILC